VESCHHIAGRRHIRLCVPEQQRHDPSYILGGSPVVSGPRGPIEIWQDPDLTNYDALEAAPIVMMVVNAP